MDIYRKRLLWKVLLLIFAVVIGLGSLFYTNDLVNKLKEEERKKAEQWAEATRRLVTSDDFEFLFSIIEDNTTVPVILIDEEESILSQRNLPASIATDTLAMVRELKRMAKRNAPISIELPNGIVNHLYYRESTLLRQLRVYPYIQLGVILLFIGVAYVAFSASRMAEQNQVWVGLSRETAHQLGTPTSSLSAWSEIISSRYPGTDIAEELPADVERLSRVAERFSLIGSKPKLQPENLPELAESTASYLRKRIASTIDLRVEDQTTGCTGIPFNPVLLGWVIENLVKNSADAMKGTGVITIRLTENSSEAVIDVEDTGRGIPRKDFKTIFKPGYTTRERGWGLGLSLSKRIIEQYHRGKIFVLRSEPGNGSCMRIILNRKG
ncbi:MAG: HAMP domain-containing histidine kinase [Bacteroidales bacterium]|jgi:signal transduction histidine kinase|nr:HAMP domain-containing histidine kinase [Bacteroidales bacterium]MDD3736031.1 HAMP domain-containing sensor histidine kinase [Bacteroidales bacterium]HNT92461.1 HAMP domain-containing sensor histidine kinase [Bacteroidales bacterium]HOO65680.1 HAMP domain-containing sensor histidine kinase [Bacteroidales bacterium]HPE21653.1 HAMP domain-containing sensor histidine kinase [Bacteroidales bacterium]